LKKRDDGKFEVLDVKLDNRKTKNLDPNSNKITDKKIDFVAQNKESKKDAIENSINLE
jgi:ribonucleoside-diphosphate reductase alpha chain